MASGMVETLLARLEAVAGRLEAAPAARAGAGAGAGGGPGSASVAAFQALVGAAGGVVKAARATGDAGVVAASEVLQRSFAGELDIVRAVAACRAPSSEQLQGLLKPVGEEMAKAQDLAFKHRSAANHCKTVAEALQGLAWVAYSGKDCGLSLPAAHVEEYWQAGEFYSNKVLREFKNTEGGAPHVEWVKSCKALFGDLKAFVKEHHPTGPAWNPKGGDPGQFKGGGGGGKALPPPAPAAPPPPPPGALDGPRATPAAGKPAGGMGAVFGEINQGASVTAGLKKVTADMKTKNRADRTHVVAAGAKKSPAAPAASRASDAGKPRAAPVCALRGNKWSVENQVENRELVINVDSARQTVYVYKCESCTIQIKGKVNAVTLDSCRRCAVVFGDVLACFEIVNSQSTEAQCTGKCPTFSFDKSDGVQLYLSEEGKGANITTAKSSEMNVLVPKKGEEGEFSEIPLPEQFISVFKDGTFVTEPVGHAG